MDSLLVSLPGSTTSVLPIEDGSTDGFLFGKSISRDRQVAFGSSFFDSEFLTVMEDVSRHETSVRNSISRLLGHKNWLIQAIEASLTLRQFQVFELYYIYGYTQEAISRILCCTQPTLSKVLSQAISRLRKKLGPTLEPLLTLKEDQLDA